MFGLGTGRCGTKSLAALLSWQDDADVQHERFESAIAWAKSEDQVHAFLDACAARPDRALVGDVAFYYLPYIEMILARRPDARFIALQRRRATTIDSYMQWTEGRNHWMKHNGTRWRHDEWDKCYPKYRARTKAGALRRYWDDYYRTFEQLRRRYPNNLRRFRVESLNTEAGQRAILDFVGIPIDQQRLAIGVRLNGSAPLPPLAIRIRHFIRQHKPAWLNRYLFIRRPE